MRSARCVTRLPGQTRRDRISRIRQTIGPTLHAQWGIDSPQLDGFRQQCPASGESSDRRKLNRQRGSSHFGRSMLSRMKSQARRADISSRIRLSFQRAIVVVEKRSNAAPSMPVNIARIDGGGSSKDWHLENGSLIGRRNLVGAAAPDG